MLVLDRLKDCVHHPLERFWGISQPEEHDVRDVYSVFCFECGFVFVLLSNTYIVIPLLYIKFGEYASIFHCSNRWWYERYGIVILNC